MSKKEVEICFKCNQKQRDQIRKKAKASGLKQGEYILQRALGAAPKEFSAGLTAGYQHSWVLRGGWQLYWQGGVTLTLPKRGDLFGVSTGVGVKMPLRDRMRR